MPEGPRHYRVEQPIDYPSPLEKTLSAYSKRNRENQLAQQESDALAQIYQQYQGDQDNIMGKMQAIQTDTRIGPTAKVNTMNQLLEASKYNQTRQKETETKLKEAREKEYNRQQVAAIAKHRGRPEEEIEQFANDPKGYEMFTRPPKDPKQTQASRPIEPEQLENIQKVRNNPEFQKASSAKKYQMLTDAGVSRENAKAESEVFAEEEKLGKEEKKISRKEELEFHKESDKFDEELNKSAKGAKNQLESIKNVEKALGKGGDSRKTLANVFRGMGTVGQKISDALLSKDQATIQASIPDFLEGRKELFGVRLSDADLKLLQDKLPDMGKSPEANTAILKLMKKYSQKSVLRQEIGAQIKKANGGLRPLGYADKIEERFDEMMAPVQVRNKKTGRIVDIPAYQVSEAIKAGGELVSEEEEFFNE